jgi:lysozyme
MSMKTSLAGLYFIMSEEACVLSTYDDGGGVLTIGVGHTAMAGNPAPVRGMTITLDDAIGLLRRDLLKYEREVDDRVTVPLTQNQFDALVSWHFNTGGVHQATLTKRLNAGTTLKRQSSCFDGIRSTGRFQGVV